MHLYNSRQVKRIIDTIASRYGIVCVDEKLVFCGYNTDGIYAFDVKTEQHTKISNTNNVGMWSYITYFKNKFYTTNEENHTVTSFENKGNVVWAYKDTVKMIMPRGISVDNSGSLFVASEGSNNVTMILPDRSCAKHILDNKGGLDKPYAHYDRFTNQLIVANVKGKVHLFNVE